MSRAIILAAGIAGLCFGSSLGVGLAVLADDKPNDKPEPKANSNALVSEHRNKLTVTASSFWPGWPANFVIDGNKKKSWFTAKDDTITLKKKPWVQIEFPADVEVRRVTVYGNQEPPWEKGYAFLAGRVDLTRRRRQGTGVRRTRRPRREHATSTSRSRNRSRKSAPSSSPPSAMRGTRTRTPMSRWGRLRSSKATSS